MDTAQTDDGGERPTMQTPRTPYRGQLNGSRGLPPAILLGGSEANALSVARSLGQRGIGVYLLGNPGTSDAYSRHARFIRLPQDVRPQDAWARYLLGQESEPLRGAVLLACSDAGIEIILEHRERLADKFVLDIADPSAQRCFLNKLSTYRVSREAGLDTPLFWTADSVEHLEAQKDEFVYPLLVKPLYSHKFVAVFGAKFFRVMDFAELMSAYSRATSHGLDVLLLEEIPGPDDRLCSLFSYVDETGAPLFAYTKRVVRRFPVNRGMGCYHVTDWIPEVRDLGLRLFEHAGLLGLGNVEFKLDQRDGKLKVIECNARFTAANMLLVASGYDLAPFVYGRLVGLPNESLDGKQYTQGLHLWWPGRDFRAFLELRKRRELTLFAWARSLAHRQVLPYFRWDDPMPSAVASSRFFGRVGRHLIRRLTAASADQPSRRSIFVKGALRQRGECRGDIECGAESQQFVVEVGRERDPV